MKANLTQTDSPQDLPVDSVSLRLGRVLDVGLVQQVLDAEQDLLDGDGRAPVLLLVQQRQTDRPGRVHVRVEQRRLELALGRAGRVVVLEDHPELVQATLPRSLENETVEISSGSRAQA